MTLKRSVLLVACAWCLSLLPPSNGRAGDGDAGFLVLLMGKEMSRVGYVQPTTASSLSLHLV